MEIHYTVTEDAFVEFNLFHAKKSKAVSKALKLQRFLGPVLYLFIPVIFSSILEIPFLSLFIPFLVISILWLVFYPAYFYGHIKRTAGKLVKEGTNEGTLGKHTLVLTEEKFVEIGPKGETVLSWDGIENLGEDESNFYLYNSAMSAFIVPKKGLPNVEEVRSYVQKKIKPAA